MKKQILNLGKTLNKVEQKRINGGYTSCVNNRDCYDSPHYAGGPVACIEQICTFV